LNASQKLDKTVKQSICSFILLKEGLILKISGYTMGRHMA